MNDLQKLPVVAAPEGLPAIMETMRRLKSIRTFVAKELAEGIDYGTIPGTGNKRTLFLPGAQKIQMYLNVYPEYRIDAKEMGAGHVEFQVRTWLVSRAGRAKVGSGVGSCSTMESKYRFRQAGRKCPKCHQEAIIKGKEEYGGGWICFQKKGGCGAKFRADAPEIAGQQVGQAENENIHDVRNTVLKMAKKRSLVDASIGLACLADQFAQDMEDVYDLDAEPVAQPMVDRAPAGEDAGRADVNRQFQPAAPAEDAGATAREPGQDDEPDRPAPPPVSRPEEPRHAPQGQQAQQPRERPRGENQPAVPTNGRAMFAWTKDQEQRYEVGLLKYLNGWAKLKDFPGRMVDWNPDQVGLAYGEACRKLQSVQANGARS